MPATKTKDTDLQDQLIDTIESAQTMVVDSVSNISDRLANFQSEDIPEPKAVWTSSFDFVEKVIESQRKFGMALLDAVSVNSPDESA